MLISLLILLLLIVIIIITTIVKHNNNNNFSLFKRYKLNNFNNLNFKTFTKYVGCNNYIYIENGTVKNNINIFDIFNTIIVLHKYDTHIGGSKQFITDLYKNLNEKKFLIIWDVRVLKLINFNTNKVILLNFFYGTNINYTDMISIVEEFNIKLVIPIHDFTLLTKDAKHPHNKYLQKMTISQDAYNLYSLANVVIIPNKFVYDKLKDILPPNNIKIIEWIDYKIINNNNYEQVHILDSTINIAFIHTFSDYKGSEYIQYLKKIKQYKNNIIKIHQIVYNDFDECLNLLKIKNIRGLLFLNKWGETYCYALTKALITNLPIFYNNIGAFITRIPKNENKYIINSNIEEKNIDFKNLTINFYKFLDFIIDNNLYFNNYYEIDKVKIEYFNKVLNNDTNFTNFTNSNKNVIIITSKILVSENSLTYINKRSIYTPEERFNDTLDTIKSIKQNIPNYYIILVDNSNFDNIKYDTLKNNVDHFINILNDDKYNYYTDIDKTKATGELYSMNLAINYLIDSNMKFKNLFKITGRYTLNKYFNYINYDNDLDIFKLSVNIDIPNYIYTCFFKLSYDTYYNSNLIQLHNDLIKLLSNNKISLEEKYFSSLISKKKVLIDTLGIAQKISPFKTVVNELNI